MSRLPRLMCVALLTLVAWCVPGQPTGTTTLSTGELTTVTYSAVSPPQSPTFVESGVRGPPTPTYDYDTGHSRATGNATPATAGSSRVVWTGIATTYDSIALLVQVDSGREATQTASETAEGQARRGPGAGVAANSWAALLERLAGRNAAETGGNVLSFGSRAAAREGLPGDLASAGNRFFRGATSKSQDFQALELPDGGYRLQFFSPANNPGYGKLYVQEIDRTGQVLREYKTTMTPDGPGETKWVHGEP